MIRWAVAIVSVAAAFASEDPGKLLAEGRYAEALAAAQALNRQQPDNPEMYRLIAEAQMALGDYAEAERAAQWMVDLRLGRTTPEGAICVARLREVTGDLDGALEMLSGALAAIDPAAKDQRAALLAQLAHVQAAAGRDARAAYAELEKAIEALPEPPANAARELILYYCGRGNKPVQALRMAQKQIARRHDVYTRDAYAWALYSNGRREEARREIEKVLEVGTRDPDIRRHADEIARPARASTDDRVARAERVAKARPEDDGARMALAAAYLQKLRETADPGYLERAAKIVDGVLVWDQNHPEALFGREEIAMQRHEFARAAALAREMTARFPEDPRHWGVLGDALMEAGDYDGAERAYQRMADLRPGLASYNRVAFFRFVTGDAEGAIAAMKQAVAIGGEPENVAWCLVDLGNMRFKTGAADQAKASYSEALRIFPGYHAAHAGLGRVSPLNEAREHFRAAQQIAPLPEYAAALADIARRMGDAAEARRQDALLDAIARLARANGEKANRGLAMAYLDEGRELAYALELARGELAFRGDVYTYDTLAWALYKNDRFREAQAAMERALRMGTPEPGFRVHAEAIKRALQRE